MDLRIIEDTITELEEAETTLENVQELAYLYIIRDKLSKPSTTNSNSVEKEYKDILPEYQNYVRIKQLYQRHELTDEAILPALKRVCLEIIEFIQILYSSTDLVKERREIKAMIKELQKIGG